MNFKQGKKYEASTMVDSSLTASMNAKLMPYAYMVYVDKLKLMHVYSAICVVSCD